MTEIDLSRLPPPEIVEEIDVASILSEIGGIVADAWPEAAMSFGDPSTPIVKVIEAFAVYTVMERGRANDQARGTMLAHAFDTTLDNLGALFGVARLVVDPGDPTTRPPRPRLLETDAALRARIQTSLEGFTTCGPTAAYAFHARSADGRIRDVTVTSPVAGVVQVTFAAVTPDGIATDAPMAAVVAALNDEDVRPLCDTVRVISARPLTYDIEAVIEIASGPDPDLILSEAEFRLRAAGERLRLIGRDVPVSAIYAALHGPSVEAVRLIGPTVDVPVAEDEVPVLGAVTLTRGTVIA